MGPIAAVIGAVASVGGTIASVNATRKAAKTQAAIAREQQKQQEASYRRQQRAAVREAQIRRAQGMALSQGAGVTGSSLVGGGMSSIGSQVGSALGFGTQLSGLSANITNLGVSAANYTQQANMFGSIAQIGGNVFQAANGPERLRNLIG